MKNLLIWHSCPANSAGIYNKALLCVNLDEESGADLGKIYHNPKNKTKFKRLTTDMNFYFVMKREGNLSLLARTHTLEGRSDKMLAGWVAEQSYVAWNQRSCIEPTWNHKDVEYFADENVRVNIYDKKDLDNCVTTIPFTRKQSTKYDAHLHRMHPDDLRFPLLDNGTDELYNCSTFGTPGGEPLERGENLQDGNGLSPLGFSEQLLREMTNINIGIVIDGTSSMEAFYPAVKEVIKEGRKFFGNKYNVSPDPDMHRVVDGHLYTDFSTSSETIIKKDGKPLITYQKPEMICDFLVHGDDVHTLGHSRTGGGFSYRINGVVVLERSNGYTFERLAIQDTTVSFAFVEPITSADGIMERYYVMREGKVSQTALRDDIRKVWDIVIFNGRTYCLASLVGLSAPVLVSDGGLTALPMPSSMSLLSCRMIVMTSGICVEGIFSDGNSIMTILWNQDLSYRCFPKDRTFSAVSYNNDVVHCAINPTSRGGAGLIYRGDESYTMPMSYACMSRDAIDFSSGMLSVGLSSLDGAKPVLWVDGQIDTLDVNGFISSIISQQL
jgi:hypothetical protein